MNDGDGLDGRRRPRHEDWLPGTEGGAFDPKVLGGLGPIDPNNPFREAQDLGDQIEGFYVSGGRTFWRTGAEVINLPGDERFAGFQVLASIDIPKGSVGFLKGVIAAPSFLEQPQTFVHVAGLTSPLVPFVPQAILGGIDAGSVPCDPCCSFWSSPQGWESGPKYSLQTGQPIGPPAATWRWGLISFQGTLENVREGLNPQILAPNIPIPASEVAALPFQQAVGFQWDRQPQQRMGPVQAATSSHLLVRPNTTVILFAEWNQQATIVPNCNRREKFTYAETQNVGQNVIFVRPPGGSDSAQLQSPAGQEVVTVEQFDAGQTTLDSTLVTTGADSAPIWMQDQTVGLSISMPGNPADIVVNWIADTFPGLMLGPSIGALQGYIQKSDRYAAKLSAVAGWQGG